jgi:polysaccharide biosynthesis protein PslG
VFADGTTGVRANVGPGKAVYFAISPRFANYAMRDVYVRVTARTEGPVPEKRYTGMNLWYQPYKGSRAKPPEYPYRAEGTWWTVPADNQWHSMTWHLTDALFAHTFGSGFYLQLDDSFPFVIGKVELSRKPFQAPSP